MARPGGGPPRKSHTKSRKGCETCKRRHIRCDENFSQCHNCTRHNCRCPYVDVPIQKERVVAPDKAYLSWAPAIETEIERWRQSVVCLPQNISAFPILGSHPIVEAQNRILEEIYDANTDMALDNWMTRADEAMDMQMFGHAPTDSWSVDLEITRKASFGFTPNTHELPPGEAA